MEKAAVDWDLVRKNEPFCWYMARRVGGGLCEEYIADIASVVRERLAYASRLFDPARGCNFITYVYRFARTSAIRAARAIRNGGIKLPTNSHFDVRPVVFSIHRTARNDSHGGARGGPDNRSDPRDTRRNVSDDPLADIWADGENAEQLRCLDPRSREILRLRFVMVMTLDEAGAALGVTRERVRQLESRAIAKLARWRSGKLVRRQLEGRT